MFKIGEFSKLTQVTIRMLRYYDETGLLKPAKIDPWTGYRMYSSDQIPILNRIIYLRDSGFQVSEIVEILNRNDDEFLIQQLRQKYHDVEKSIRAEQEKLRKIETARKEILINQSKMYYNISVKSVPVYQVLSLRRTVDNYYEEGRLWEELSSFAKRHRIEIVNNTFSIYHDTDYRETNVDIELCAPVNKMGESRGVFVFRNTEPVPIMASTMVYGDFSKIAGAYQSFAAWLQKNSRYRMRGLNRQIVHRGPWNESNPENYLTEIQIPMKIRKEELL